MRTVALTALLVAFSYAASAQKFTLLPQVGFENSRTVINYNDVNCISPLGVKFSPQGSLRLNYSSKKGHGFFIGAATSRASTVFSFNNLENGAQQYIATPGNLQVRLEGGYQFSTKPIFFKNNKTKQAAAKKATVAKKQTATSTTTTVRRGCGGKTYTVTSRCGASAKKTEIKQKENTIAAPKGSWMRFQPSVGLGFVPDTRTDLITKTQAGQTTYQYSAGNMNTAFITGAGFEFGRSNTRLFTVNVNYFNGIGNMGKRTISVTEAGKTTTTSLQSDVSGWSVRVGIPFNLGKSATAKNKDTKVQKTEYRCGQQSRTIYRCRRSI
jgi:hypothetical protein